MATPVDTHRGPSRGSYFDILGEKYPDLAPPAPAADRNPPRDVPAVEFESSAAACEATADVVESSWLATVVLVLLALALLFPPALLWRPSWIPAEGNSASLAEIARPSVPQAASPAAARAATSANGDGAPKTDGHEEPSAQPKVDVAAELPPPRPVPEGSMGDGLAVANLGSSQAPSPTDPGQAAAPAGTSTGEPPPRAALVAVTPESAADVGEGETAPAPAAALGLLEVATAGPKIQPARRLSGAAPKWDDGHPRQRAVRVRLRNHINPQGEVIGVDVLQGLSVEADRQLAESMRQWRYAPATVDGRAVSSQQEVVFVLPPTGLAQVAENEPVEPARRRSTPLPGYTTEAWVQGTEGDVELLASIDSRGAVTEIEVIRGLPHGLTESAVDAVERWTFDPARRQGKAISSTQRLRLRFAL